MDLNSFLTKWQGSEGSERSHAQHFLIDLCSLVGLPSPGTHVDDDLRLEKDVALQEADGEHLGRADLVRRGAFVIECKQFTAKERRSKTWHLGMQEALGQALGYARGLPDVPVFVIACDVGHCFELLACFDGSGHWRPFPAGSNRIYLSELNDPKKFAQLKTALTDPKRLDPTKLQIEVTTKVAAQIGELAKALRAAGHDKAIVAKFLLRCLFTMFAEDVHLFENNRRVFEEYLRDHWLPKPDRFPLGVAQLWQKMDTGGYLESGERVQKFNGGLFRDHTALPLNKEQLQLLLEAARHDWSKVEPAIFGTLLENALGEKERHELGAHFTPKAYVERLVRPTIEEPLRAEWVDVRFKVRTLLEEGGKSDAKALAELKAFHQRLCKIRVLDPACGTGNFLYVAMELLKTLEGEVLEEIRRVGGAQSGLLELDEVTVSPKQFLGIEVNPWAKEIAEIVLWIGYLRWQWQLRGTTKAFQVEDSILRDEHNIECRDAVLDWDGTPNRAVKRDAKGKPVTRWDGETTKVDPVTGREVPDERASVPIYEYPAARKAQWPSAEFIVGNPPFVGNKRMRLVLGDGYVEALRAAYPEVSEASDLVMYWWYRAGAAVQTGECRAAGLIATNSMRQPFNRGVLAAVIDGGAAISFAIPDHPWVDAELGAAVRIAMVSLVRGAAHGRLFEVTSESASGDGSMITVLSETQCQIGADLRPAAQAVRRLLANSRLGFRGVTLVGDGFLLDGSSKLAGSPRTRQLVGAQALLGKAPPRQVLDLYGLSEAEARSSFPAEYQHLLTTVKPVRDAQERRSYAERWWVFAEPRGEFRSAARQQSRWIGTVETSKFRWFAFVDGEALPEQTLIAVASEDAFVLGVLSSRVHGVFAVKRGSRNGKGNDPRYTIAECFDVFPFPVVDGRHRERVAGPAERLDAHRKRQLAAHPKLTVTAMYNVLAKLRSGEALNEKDKVIHDDGLVSILKQLHEELDAAVLDAYGWPRDVTDEQILEKLVALNGERAAEEARGIVRYLRPDFQAPKTEILTQPTLAIDEPDDATDSTPPPPTALPDGDRPWPKDYFARAHAVRDLVASLPDGTKFEASMLDARFKGKNDKRRDDIAKILSTFAKLGLFVTLARDYYARPVRRSA